MVPLAQHCQIAASCVVIDAIFMHAFCRHAAQEQLFLDMFACCRLYSTINRLMKDSTDMLLSNYFTIVRINCSDTIATSVRTTQNQALCKYGKPSHSKTLVFAGGQSCPTNCPTQVVIVSVMSGPGNVSCLLAPLLLVAAICM